LFLEKSPVNIEILIINLRLLVQKPIYITKPYFPPIEKYFNYIKGCYEKDSLTNNGPLVQELTEKLKSKLGVKHLLLVSNGTIALQIAYKIKNLAHKNVITTPYTFAATSTALMWQNSKVVLADIDKDCWNIDPKSVNDLLLKNKGEAIVAVNLFGHPCDLDALDEIARYHNVPLIYDSAHALLSKYKGRSIYDYGDIHCISFHATKLFHTIEGGAIVFRDESEYLLAKKLINFGIDDNGIIEQEGINAKLSEVHAAMGLCVLDDLDDLVIEREELIKKYKKNLLNSVTYQKSSFDCQIQPIYMPVKFKTEAALINAEVLLNKAGYFPRRYFMPQQYCFLPQSQQKAIESCSLIANKILCLPLMNGLEAEHVLKIANLLTKDSLRDFV
jgi:dTDP-4-amino-4,6-dideoxygalactose transaminase